MAEAVAVAAVTMLLVMVGAYYTFYSSPENAVNSEYFSNGSEIYKVTFTPTGKYRKKIVCEKIGAKDGE